MSNLYITFVSVCISKKRGRYPQRYPLVNRWTFAFVVKPRNEQHAEEREIQLAKKNNVSFLGRVDGRVGRRRAEEARQLLAENVLIILVNHRLIL
ncbi:unnamed protein product [Victoria cruziana]